MLIPERQELYLVVAAIVGTSCKWQIRTAIYVFY